ncbi:MULTISPECIES: DUF3710 domain-containing protein [Glycomyces]|uniref:DUF3710 domain-containing protein n=1 Tax=Glycomyces artemisiae TaxID=1076443 RepID=A0A2T0UIK9_9ACTN|nr:DUF3710 domain-containing protein [Glycomyces artemisiae]NUQ89668.1 DUF3710 domain-containing protein [Glycomyces artemisiae]PRY57667.1 uncharacterized protein DUF3710 [Glycomyces artemisiae]
MFKRRRGSKKQRPAEGAVLDSLAESGDTYEREATEGPYDVADAPEDEIRRIDLGAIRLPVPKGVGFQAQTDAKGNISQVLLTTGASALQLLVRAAPRSEGIWPEIREELAATVKGQGGETEEVEGRWGTELIAKVATKKGVNSVRFCGVDGPRWFVQATFQGQRALDEDAAPELDEALTKLVIDRGSIAMPVREPLPLKLPPKMAEEAAARIAQRKAEGGDGSRAIIAAGDTPRPQVRRKPSPRPKR